MKKLFAVVLASLVATAMFAGCGNNKSEAPKEVEKEAVVDETITEAEDVEVAEDEETDVAEETDVIFDEEFSFEVDVIDEAIFGYWETIDEFYGMAWGYRFNEDGTIDFVQDGMYETMGIYKYDEEGVHYSDDGENWDPLVMVVDELTDTTLTVSFDGEVMEFTKSDAELEMYMPEGWTYETSDSEETEYVFDENGIVIEEK